MRNLAILLLSLTCCGLIHHASAQCEGNQPPVIEAPAVVSGTCTGFPQPAAQAMDEDSTSVSLSVQTFVTFSTHEDLHTPAMPEDNPCLYLEEAGFMLFSVPSSYKYWTVDSGDYAILPDGSVHFTALVTNTNNPNGKLFADIYLGPGMSWTEWETSPGQGGMPATHGYKADCGGIAANHEDWTYYIIQENSSVVGQGDYAGSVFDMHHAPANMFYGYQFGVGANNYSPEYGSGGWFVMNGNLQDASTGQTLSLNTAGDFAFMHTYSHYSANIQHVFTATDNCGATSTFTQTVEVCENPGPILTNMPVAGQVMGLCDFLNWQPQWISHCEGNIEDEIAVQYIANLGSEPQSHHIVTMATDACGGQSLFSFDVMLYNDGPCAPSLACSGDFDQDQVVGNSDLLEFVGGFNSNEETYDLTGDSQVDILDFLTFISQYGNFCDSQD